MKTTTMKKDIYIVVVYFLFDSHFSVKSLTLLRCLFLFLRKKALFA